MTLSSMTGFARQDGAWEDDQWAWEIRSVNSKNLDIRVRVPGFLEGLEQDTRKMTSEAFKRGSLQINLHFQRGEVASEITINKAALGEILSVIEALKLEVEAGPPTLDGLLSLKGVIDTHEKEEGDTEKKGRLEALRGSLQDTLTELKASRDLEGERLTNILSDQVAQIESLTEEAHQIAKTLPRVLQTKLNKQLDELLEERPGLPEERIAQEIAFLVTKSDIREEIDRLRAHCTTAREFINETGPVGRKLDFLTQELNRESNTLCSKSADVELTRIGLDLKTVVDQMREQVQNIE